MDYAETVYHVRANKTLVLIQVRKCKQGFEAAFQLQQWEKVGSNTTDVEHGFHAKIPIRSSDKKACIIQAGSQLLATCRKHKVFGTEYNRLKRWHAGLLQFQLFPTP